RLRRAGCLEGAADVPAVLRACLEYLAAEPSGVVLANLEDLWQETESQNVPGTSTERPNWRHKARHALEELDRVPGLRDTFLALTRRTQTRSGKGVTQPPQ